MILTVSFGRQGREWFDIDVADDCTGVQLKAILGLKLFGEPPKNHMQYILEVKQPEGLWSTVPEQQRLLEAGVREGAYIRVQRAFSTTTDSAPSFGRRALFQLDEADEHSE
ncbi:hypothetical protein [Paenibacillus alvei]|uniref:Ubiquitin-like domain-containing protein n=1 Tax=Paenibacillus alvei TaxID=44250 RepID=A0A383RCS7_PAEAL|nr:hypothetical protein [Paenibacillus alvei]SYX84905.1 conserved protein of unknown function [Paenibacillus alvei]